MEWSNNIPRVFISYSWWDIIHQKWILDLAERLSNDWIHVVLDKWDLKEWQDMYSFMEEMVKSEEINKVLVISDEHYQKKADTRKWWVWTESQLISQEVYQDVKQQKFIPIVKEKNKEWKACLPIFLKSRIYIDLSSDERYEDEYEKLVRNIYWKALSKRPAIWVAPSYITEDETDIILKTSNKTKQLKNTIFKTNFNINWNIRDYFDTFLSNLQDFKIEKLENWEHIDDIILDRIQKMLPLRDDFIEFTNTIFKSEKEIDIEIFEDFFEELIKFQYKPSNINYWNKIYYDHYKFLNNEIFVYFNAILLKLKKFKTLWEFLEKEYFFYYDNTWSLDNSNYTIFNNYIHSLDENRKRRLNLNRISITADLLKERTNNIINFEEFKEADLLLYYIWLIKWWKRSWWWFPRSSVYNSRWGDSLFIFKKLISKKYCEKFKNIFNLDNISEFKWLFEKISKAHNWLNYNSFEYRIPDITKIVDIEKIGTIN